MYVFIDSDAFTFLKRRSHEKRRHVADHRGGVRRRLDDGIRLGHLRVEDQSIAQAQAAVERFFLRLCFLKRIVGVFF